MPPSSAAPGSVTQRPQKYPQALSRSNTPRDECSAVRLGPARRGVTSAVPPWFPAPSAARPSGYIAPHGQNRSERRGAPHLHTAAPERHSEIATCRPRTIHRLAGSGSTPYFSRSSPRYSLVKAYAIILPQMTGHRRASSARPATRVSSGMHAPLAPAGAGEGQMTIGAAGSPAGEYARRGVGFGERAKIPRLTRPVPYGITAYDGWEMIWQEQARGSIPASSLYHALHPPRCGKFSRWPSTAGIRWRVPACRVVSPAARIVGAAGTVIVR